MINRNYYYNIIHCENDGTKEFFKRVFAFMIFLNDVKNINLPVLFWSLIKLSLKWVLIFFISISLISVNGVFENGMDYTVELPTTIYVNEPFNFTLNTLTQSGFNLDYSIVDFGTNELKHYNLNN